MRFLYSTPNLTDQSDMVHNFTGDKILQIVAVRSHFDGLTLIDNINYRELVHL